MQRSLSEMSVVFRYAENITFWGSSITHCLLSWASSWASFNLINTSWSLIGLERYLYQPTWNPAREQCRPLQLKGPTDCHLCSLIAVTLLLCCSHKARISLFSLENWHNNCGPSMPPRELLCIRAFALPCGFPVVIKHQVLRHIVGKANEIKGEKYGQYKTQINLSLYCP